jgi:hypothetical protein
MMDVENDSDLKKCLNLKIVQISNVQILKFFHLKNVQNLKTHIFEKYSKYNNLQIF